jgi:predicted transcriptional regulator
MVRRSRLEIYFDVLRAIDNGTDKPTRIMYETNLSWTNINDVLDALFQVDFIRVEIMKTSKRYYITKKGRNALSYHLKSVEGLFIISKN